MACNFLSLQRPSLKPHYAAGRMELLIPFLPCGETKAQVISELEWHGWGSHPHCPVLSSHSFCKTKASLSCCQDGETQLNTPTLLQNLCGNHNIYPLSTCTEQLAHKAHLLVGTTLLNVPVNDLSSKCRPPSQPEPLFALIPVATTPPPALSVWIEAVPPKLWQFPVVQSPPPFLVLSPSFLGLGRHKDRKVSLEGTGHWPPLSDYTVAPLGLEPETLFPKNQETQWTEVLPKAEMPNTLLSL